MSNQQKPVKLLYSPDGSTISGLKLDGYVQSANFYSQPQMMKSVDNWSLIFTCPATGSPNGTLQIQASNDEGAKENSSGAQSDPSISNWVNLYFWNDATSTFVNSLAVSGASSVLIEENNCTYRWMRIFWTNTSGSITPTAVHLQFKGITPATSGA